MGEAIMADEKKVSMPEDVGVDKPQQETSITEKLEAAAGNIDRHHADSKQRESALIRESKEKAKEERQRAKEAEKRNVDLHREAVLNAAAEREAFEEQRKLRKKLERERRRKMEEERRAAEEAKRQRDEARAKEVAEALEKERAEIDARLAKSAEILNRVNTVEEPEEADSELPETAPAKEETVPETAPAKEETVPETSSVVEPVPDVKEEPVEEPAVKEAIPEAEPASEPEMEEEVVEQPAVEEYDGDVTKADLDVSLHHGDGKYLITLGDEKKPVGDFVIEINDEEPTLEKTEEPALEQPAAPKKAASAQVVHETPASPKPAERGIPKVKSGKIPVSAIEPGFDQTSPGATSVGGGSPSRIRLDKPNLAEVDLFDIIEEEPEREVIERIPIEIYEVDEESGKVVIDKPKADEDIPPLTFEDDLITSIKKQGKAVNDRKSYKKYIKRSDKAINAFYSDINRIDKNIENVEDENQVPPMIVDSITIMGKIVDIRSDNLSVTAKTQKKKVTDKCREALARDIENYNSRVAYFTKVTGSKLTKLSAFLPDAIANGTGRPVIPELKYTENYIEIFPDADGNLPSEDDNVSTIVIAPIVSFEEEIGNVSPKNRDEAKDFIGRVNKSKKTLLEKINSTAKAIEKNAKAKRKNLEKEEGAFTAREQDVTDCYESFTRKERRGKKFAKIVESIDDRYRKVIVEAREEREDKRYDDVDKCLHVERLTAERERVVFTLEAIRSLRGVVTPKELRAIVASVVREMQTYNALAKECGERIEKELSTVSGALADEVMRTGEKYQFPMIVKRRELCERVGKTKRIVGDRVREDYLKTTKAERLKRIKEKFNFDGDKSISDRALMREDIRLRAIERLAEGVRDKKTFKRLVRKCKYSFREFKRTLKQTDKAIFRARDRDGVIVAVTENLRVRGKFIAAVAVALECSADNGKKKFVKKYTSLLEKQIDRYNSRCADFRNITRSKANQRRGWKLTQISSFLPENIAEGLTSATVPELSYREHYIECIPKTKETENAYVDPAKRDLEYTPIDYNDRRYTENDMVEVTVINSPISAAEVMRNDKKTKGYLDARAATWAPFWFMYRAGGLNRYLKRARRHKNRALRQEKKFDKKLNKLIKRYERKTRNLNDSTPELLRDSPKYVRKMSKIEAKYHKKSIKLRYKRVKRGIERRVLNYSVRELAIFREYVMIQALTLKRVRTSAAKKWIGEAKKNLVSAIREHNDIADALSIILGKPIARISTTVAEEIIREGSCVLPLPKIAICRETLETVGDGMRAIGDPYRHGMPYTINSQGIAVVTGTCRIAPGVGINGIGLDADLKPIIGATHSGLYYAGTPNPNVLGIALNSNVSTSATRAGKNSPVYGIPTELMEPEDDFFSDIDKKAVSDEIKEINNYLVGAIGSRAEAVSSVFDYRHYVRRSRFVGKKVEKIFKTNNKLFKKYDKQVRDIFTEIIPSDNLKGIRLSTGNLTRRFMRKLDREGAMRAWQYINENWAREREKLARLEEKHIVKLQKKQQKHKRRKITIPALTDWRTMDKPNVKAFHLLVGDLRERRARVFNRFEQARYLEQYRYVFELRTLSALGKFVEIRCADLCAAAKLQLTIPRQFKLWLLLLGFNPRKKCRRRLTAAIEKYNNIHVSRAEKIIGLENDYDLSLINTMLPEGLANREFMPDIPTLVYRDRFAEVVPTKVSAVAAVKADREEDEINYVKRTVDTEYGDSDTVIPGVYMKQTARSDDEGDDELEDAEPEVNLINATVIPLMPDIRRNKRFFNLEEAFNADIAALERSREAGIPKHTSEDKRTLGKRDFEKLIRALINKRHGKLTDRLDDIIESALDDAESYGDRNEKFVKKKLFALHRYEKAVFRISRITHETARYQRKMSRRLKRFRKRLYRLRMKEIRFGIEGSRVKRGATAYDTRLPNMSFAELRRKSAVEAMLLERRRLILAVYLCRAVHGSDPNDKEFRRKSAWLSRARRIVTSAMIHYKEKTAECERILKIGGGKGDGLWTPDMSWYKHVQVGSFDKAIAEIPKLVALRQLAEEYDEIKPIDQRSRSAVIPPRAEPVETEI